jgi:hypothetical protein
MTTQKAVQFPAWLPAIAHQAQLLFFETKREKNPTKALEVLLRLISDERMNLVWRRLYIKKNATESKDPGAVSYKAIAARLRQRAQQLRNEGLAESELQAKYLEAEADFTDQEKFPAVDARWSEQDRAAQLFLWHNYKNALDIKPQIYSDFLAKSKNLTQIAQELRTISAKLDSLKPWFDARPELERIAARCEDAARLEDPKTFDDDPGLIRRRTGNEEWRTYIVNVSSSANLFFGNDLHGVVARVANVVFCRSETDTRKADAKKVKEILGL